MMSSLETTRALLGASRRPFFEGPRYMAAWLLMGASALLSRLAVRLLPAPVRLSDGAGQLEFHADPGGLAGGLYVDGEWVASLSGVARL